MEETPVMTLAEYMKAEVKEAAEDYKERIADQERATKRYTEYSKILSLSQDAREISETINGIYSWLRIFEAFKDYKMVYWSNVPQKYLQSPWPEFAEKMEPKFRLLLESALQKKSSLETEVKTPHFNSKGTNSVADMLSNFKDEAHKQAILDKLEELLNKNKSGRFVAAVIEALERKRYLYPMSMTVKEIVLGYKIQCSNTGIHNYLRKGKTEELIQQIMEDLP